MNMCIIIAAFAGFFSMSLHGATGQISSADSKRKIEQDKLAEEFWELARTYNGADKPVRKRNPLRTMLTMLKKHPHLFGRCQQIFSIKCTKGEFAVAPCYPVNFASEIAHGRYVNDFEWQIFEYAIRHDPDEKRRIEVMKRCISDYSFERVYGILAAGTNVTQAPDVMRHLVLQCMALDRHCEPLTSQERISKNVETLASIRAQLNFHAEQRLVLAHISHLLLIYRADISSALQLIHPSHRKWCTSCWFIALRDCSQKQNRQASSRSLLNPQEKNDHKIRDGAQHDQQHDQMHSKSLQTSPQENHVHQSGLGYNNIEPQYYYYVPTMPHQPSGYSDEQLPRGAYEQQTGTSGCLPLYYMSNNVFSVDPTWNNQ